MTQARGKRGRSNRDGFILVIALVFTSLLGAGSLLAVSGTLGVVQSAGNQLRDKRAFFGADGSAALCRGELRNRLLIALPARMAAVQNISAITPFAPSAPGDPADTGDPAGLLVTYAYLSGTSFGGPFVRDPSTSKTTAKITWDGHAAQDSLAYSPSGAAAPYTCRMTVSSRVRPVDIHTGSGPPIYLFRYAYAITGTAADGNQARQVELEGTFSLLLQNDSFARYALFTNQQTSGGSSIWFTNRTTFSGPVHTNGKFNFANNPSGRFTDVVTSANVNPSTGVKYNPPTSAVFYNSGSATELNADRNGNLDVPVFESEFLRDQTYIPMPLGTTATRHVEKALGLADGAMGDAALPGNPLGLSTGVHLGTSGGAMTGGVYINSGTGGSGNPVAVSLAGGATAVYSVTIGGATSTVTVDPVARATTLQPASGSATRYSGVPNGMVFVNGQVGGLAGTVQRDTQMTIAATSDVVITNNVVYENYTAGATPSAEGTTNLLGVMSWNGNVRIANSAPNDLSIHATVMTPTREFRVDSYNTGSTRGNATVLGGVIENTYGPFGTFGSSTTGYGRNFVYDTRMRKGMSPPFFPTIARVIATVTGFNDRSNWQQTR